MLPLKNNNPSIFTMKSSPALVLGLDFGTESVRALLADTQRGEIEAISVRYAHGQIVNEIPSSLTGSGRPIAIHTQYAFQEPNDWLQSAAKAVRALLRKTGQSGESIRGIGVDFTSCTMLPTTLDGTPLCWREEWKNEPFAWPKLWKHHGAQSQTDRINQIATKRNEPFLPYYGHVVGLEWFFPKILETMEKAPQIYDAAEVWLEAGDWFVWQLVGGPAIEMARSTCQAGYKGMWTAPSGYPSEAFLKAVNPRWKNIAKEKLPGRLVPPGVAAGGLTKEMAKRFGLSPDTPVSAAIIDAHAGVPGAGAAEPGTLVMVMGTSSCHMLNSCTEAYLPGVAGVVKDGILPGYYGYETGQAAVGDAFDWLRRITNSKSLSSLGDEAAALPAGADGLLCLDWFHGCRTPLMNGNLRGAFTGLSLQHSPAHMYRALLEASAMGLRWIVELLESGNVEVNRFVATGGLPHHNPLMVQVYADVLNTTIEVHPSKNGPALGAAILGAMAAGLFPDSESAIRAMSMPKRSQVKSVKPNRNLQKTYDALYRSYRDLATFEQQRV
jgi:L-ribulokinase